MIQKERLTEQFFEFVKIGDKYGIDVMYETVPADHLQTELDTCWVNVGGEDPAKFIEKYNGRTPVVHLKDFVRGENGLVSVAAGTGEMDYTAILRFLKARKPYIQATLENTSNDNAVQSRELIERIYASV